MCTGWARIRIRIWIGIDMESGIRISRTLLDMLPMLLGGGRAGESCEGSPDLQHSQGGLQRRGDHWGRQGSRPR